MLLATPRRLMQSMESLCTQPVQYENIHRSLGKWRVQNVHHTGSRPGLLSQFTRRLTLRSRFFSSFFRHLLRAYWLFQCLSGALPSSLGQRCGEERSERGGVSFPAVPALDPPPFPLQPSDGNIRRVYVDVRRPLPLPPLCASRSGRT